MVGSGIVGFEVFVDIELGGWVCELVEEGGGEIGIEIEDVVVVDDLEDGVGYVFWCVVLVCL